MTEKEILRHVIEENLVNKEEIRQQVLNKAHQEREAKYMNNKKSSFLDKKYLLIPAAACAAVFVIMVNTSTVFASSISKIPILNNIAKVVTISEYTLSREADETHVKMPSITDSANKELEQRINKEVSDTIQALTEQAEIDSAEYKKNYIAAGNKESDYIPMSYDFDYKVHCSNDNILSFVVTQTERNNTIQQYLDESGISEPAEYVTQYMYNIDMKTGKNITLQDLLGDQYKQVANREIERQVKERAKEDSNLLDYYEEFYASKGARGIEDDQQFYINEAGNPVLVFDTYIIAPLYAGIQEFEIQKQK
ncbi:DUF3298 domain-containing protein [Paenibacillus sp. GCM10028914]|uniref:DUF3298 and DUF4163 domain-containing protein n=1 Tax=Paenibacillus sp. GCM10028914 TaxID=3273416 RepID=UPI00360AA345